ncbi:helix-turn-helix domain-containing protein [Priestia flexa]|uniref:helix-turn-helix domain-containing protein n=1 Tax=Priestia flexa TaxID=86664 RepID=UPI003F85175E
MKKRIEVIASVESFNNLSTFKDLEEMNETVRTYKDMLCTSIKRADVRSRLIALLELLKRHSCKQLGVSYMNKNTIAAKLEVSYKTVQRLMKKLEDLKVIKQVPMKRSKDMLQTSNAIVIEPIEEMSDKTPIEKSKKCPAIKTTNPSLKQNINNKRNTACTLTSKVANSFSKANFVPHWVPEQFADLVSCFYNESSTISEMWKVVKQCNRVINYMTEERAFTPQQELTVGLKAVKELVMKVKQKAKIDNLFGYFNGIVNNVMDKLYFDSEFIGDQ